MPPWICVTCGVQRADTPEPPAGCAICLDERQYVPAGGQRWTTLDALTRTGHRTEVRELEPDLLGLGVSPAFGIGQRALVVRSGGEVVLWDPPGYLDAAAVGRVADFGRLAAVAASHPHFYGVMTEWSHALGGAPILVPEADLGWVGRPDPAVRAWTGRVEVLPGLTLHQCGGHFPGSAVLHWPAGAGGRGALFTGDTVSVAPDRRFVSFMRSYPNWIPLPAGEVERIAGLVTALAFDRVYGGWWDRVIDRDGRAAVLRSRDRYLHWLSGTAARES